MLDGWVSAAFGTADPQRFERCFAAVHQAAVQQFPRLPNALALTSPRIQAHLAAQGKLLPLVGEALSQLAEQGCRRVAVNSLLLAEGAEWDKLRSQVEQRRAAALFKKSGLRSDAGRAVSRRARADPGFVGTWLCAGSEFGLCRAADTAETSGPR